MLLFVQLLHLLTREMTCAYAVLETVVHRSGEHIVHTAKLLQVTQALELLCIYYVPAKHKLK